MADDDKPKPHVLDWIRPTSLGTWFAVCSCGKRVEGGDVGDVRAKAKRHGAKLRGSRPAA